MQFDLAYGTYRTLSLAESDALSPVQLNWWYKRFIAQRKSEQERERAGNRRERDFRSMAEEFGSNFGFVESGTPLD